MKVRLDKKKDALILEHNGEVILVIPIKEFTPEKYPLGKRS
jgi:hypothetical protein